MSSLIQNLVTKNKQKNRISPNLAGLRSDTQSILNFYCGIGFDFRSMPLFKA